MTPNDIEFLIHCHVSPRVHKRIESNAIQETIEYLLEAGLITPYSDRIYSATKKGRAHLFQLCNLPLPRQKQVFVDYEGKEINPNV